MKTWIQLIELMDTKVPIKVVWDDVEGYETEFKVGELKYHFSAMLELDDEDADVVEYEIAFSRIGKNEEGRLNANFDVIGDLGLKDALTVFSGIKASLTQWLKTYTSHRDFGKPGFDLPRFFFSAKSEDKSRSKLYDKFAKQIAKKLKYKFNRRPHGKSIYYSFTP